MSFDGLVAGAIVKQLSEELTGGRIEKIYHPDHEELIFHVQKGREKHLLYISACSNHAGIYLMSAAGSNPQTPTAFCMLLRKHFQGGRIAEIRQVDSERVIEILVDGADEMGYATNRKLIVEIMGKHSNVIALDLTTGKILDCIKRIPLGINRYRQLLPGLIYVAPPGQGKRPLYTLTEEQLTEILPQQNSFDTTGLNPLEEEARRQSLARALVSGIQGVSPAIAAEMAQQATDMISLYRIVSSFGESILSGSITPVVYLGSDQVPVEFHVFPLAALADACRSLSFPTPSAAVEYFFSHRNSSNQVRQKSSDLSRTLKDALDKQYLKKQRLREDILQAENADIYRLYGELLTASLHAIPQGAAKAEVLNYYDNQMIEIPLDPRFSPAQNMQRYFKKYGKAKTAIKEKTLQLSETDQTIDYLESVLLFVENAASVEEIEEIRQELVDGGYLRRRKNTYVTSKSKLQPYAYTTSDGFRILAGRNNKENDVLTFKTADKKDLWFHTKDIPGSHVILFNEGRQPSKTAILEAAALAAFHSKGRNSENVPVDYTQVRYVKKPSGAKPGMVIFTDNRTVYVTPKAGPK